DVNARGDLAVIATAVSRSRFPSTLLFLRDDISGPTSWTTLALRNGLSSPRTDRWGDFQTIIRTSPGANNWVVATYTVQDTGVEPLYMVVGRQRDAPGATPTGSPAPPSGSPGPSPSMSPTPSPTPTPSSLPTPAAAQSTVVFLPNVTRMLG